MEKGTLILVGVVCVIGAIVGGGVKVIQVELRTFDSLWRQTALGVFGIVLILFGVAQPNGDDAKDAIAAETPDTAPPSEAASPSPAATPSLAVEPAVPPAAEGPSQDVALTSRVDVIWCGGESAGFNRNLADRIGQAVGNEAPATQWRVRQISAETNAGSSYSIHHAIVRYDPGEEAQAKRLADIASAASGLEFRATPALPGSPSVDYLSVFVCD